MGEVFRSRYATIYYDRLQLSLEHQEDIGVRQHRFNFADPQGNLEFLFQTEAELNMI